MIQQQILVPFCCFCDFDYAMFVFIPSLLSAVLIAFDCTWPTAIRHVAREVCTCASVRGSGLAAQEVSMVHEVPFLLALEDADPTEIGDQKTKTNVMDKVTSRMIGVLNLQRRIGMK